MPYPFVQLNISSRYAETRPLGYFQLPTGCWEWNGGQSDGYAIWERGGKKERVHRLVYERERGKIPTGLQLDHLCRNRKCVNPDHLEAVTNKENVLRGIGLTAQNAGKTHCPKGHAYTIENVYRNPHGWRFCRQCKRDRKRADRQK